MSLYNNRVIKLRRHSLFWCWEYSCAFCRVVHIYGRYRKVTLLLQHMMFIRLYSCKKAPSTSATNWCKFGLSAG